MSLNTTRQSASAGLFAISMCCDGVEMLHEVRELQPLKEAMELDRIMENYRIFVEVLHCVEKLFS